MSIGQAQAGNATPKWHVSSLERFFRRSGLFRWPLKRNESLKVRSGLQDPWRGNAAAGAIILANGIDWNSEAVDGNDFSWIRHLRALGGGKARVQQGVTQLGDVRDKGELVGVSRRDRRGVR